jgi:hypothetical protein
MLSFCFAPHLLRFVWLLQAGAGKGLYGWFTDIISRSLDQG